MTSLLPLVELTVVTIGRLTATQVNVLGPFALMQQLQPLLAAAPAARLVAVASVMHRKAALPSDLATFFR